LVKHLLFLAVALLSAGCSSWHLGPYVSPRVTGRVLAAETLQPIAGVTVSRGRAEHSRSAYSPKGAEILMQKEPVRTDQAGQFELGSERILALLPWGGWSTVWLTFDCPGYQRLQTNLSATALATNSPSGEPMVQAGDVLLRRNLK
jgi:hypothetical protein